MISAETAEFSPAIGRNLRRDIWLLVVAALVLRVAYVAWAASRFPPAEDGKYYDIVAWRIARGLGYTWLWPDGAVTYAAHYPVGYPALLGGLYALFGRHPWLGMVLNAVLGALTVGGVVRVAASVASRRGAIIAGVIALLHPTLLFYTPALMTEIASACFLAVGAWLALDAAQAKSVAQKYIKVLALGLLMGIAVLVRPQQVVLAPVLGALALGIPGATSGRVWKRQSLGAAGVTALAIICCLPWTYRNCERMGRCMLVSANAGWNLLIGTAAEGRGAWVSVDQAGVPGPCRTVFDEAKKDVCFGEGAQERIKAAPLPWLSLIPQKLERTFDDVGTPGWYLHSSNGQQFPDGYKRVLGSGEVLVQRAVLLMALLGSLRVAGPRKKLRTAVVVAAIPFAFMPMAWVSVLLFVVATLLLGWRSFTLPPLLLAGVGLGVTAVIHAMFFGGARYAIVTMPWTIAAAACVFRPRDRNASAGAPAHSELLPE